MEQRILSSDGIYYILEQEIVSLAVKPGEHLSENILCKRFSVSRTPIRSVLQRLEQNGFVETMVLRDFVKTCSPTDAARAGYAFRLMEQTAERNYAKPRFDINEFLDADLAMHEIWFKATRKTYLWENLTRPQADYSRFIRLDIVGAKNVPDVLAEHRQMLAIINSKKMSAIETLMSRHLNGGIHRMGSQLFSEEYKYFFAAETP